ncbi:hypothetical protein GCM10025861_22950 [Methanobacterium petrolearium]|nr:hypothetical protein GCM10025861_22950 [Methanobacterium petrolearium]
MSSLHADKFLLIVIKYINYYLCHIMTLYYKMSDVVYKVFPYIIENNNRIPGTTVVKKNIS